MNNKFTGSAENLAKVRGATLIAAAASHFRIRKYLGSSPSCSSLLTSSLHLLTQLRFPCPVYRCVPANIEAICHGYLRLRVLEYKCCLSSSHGSVEMYDRTRHRRLGMVIGGTEVNIVGCRNSLIPFIFDRIPWFTSRANHLEMMVRYRNQAYVPLMDSINIVSI